MLNTHEQAQILLDIVRKNQPKATVSGSTVTIRYWDGEVITLGSSDRSYTIDYNRR